ncbi:uncharacterized protein PODANS_1_14880 [Podospora anserina S mat+]|uniref:Podospora anserina S mat+ genomic DNA chromosome 1, supercontig 4 n=1 Tax=Podospora anserina (strain S / ATCC MYA-4624 / DSM 980 / FGSC 10383) TaxID=515849 RepID=B2AT72_PODAN|nr:uncharacterized protein PODANS_1_14880 [Podospora anserina S mat+]CAP67595.1 unnamed protein product [Podospora anserina S mat+]
MSGYRVERATTGRAGCKDPVCKKENIKIEKGQLRFGVWVTIMEHGSWAWRHWGCVSGETISNLQEYLSKDKNGEYNWDMLDGWEELEEYPDLRQKVQRVLNQGHIDAEDFNGDPEFNVPGQKGIRPRHPGRRRTLRKRRAMELRLQRLLPRSVLLSVAARRLMKTKLRLKPRPRLLLRRRLNVVARRLLLLLLRTRIKFWLMLSRLRSKRNPRRRLLVARRLLLLLRKRTKRKLRSPREEVLLVARRRRLFTRRRRRMRRRRRSKTRMKLLRSPSVLPLPNVELRGNRRRSLSRKLSQSPRRHPRRTRRRLSRSRSVLLLPSVELGARRRRMPSLSLRLRPMRRLMLRRRRPRRRPRLRRRSLPRSEEAGSPRPRLPMPMVKLLLPQRSVVERRLPRVDVLNTLYPSSTLDMFFLARQVVDFSCWHNLLGSFFFFFTMSSSMR